MKYLIIPFLALITVACGRHQHNEKDLKLVAALTDTSLKGRGSIDLSEKEYIYQYYDVYEKDSDVAYLQV